MSNPASLLDKQSMGGIHGEAGYKFQDAYIVTKIPDWIDHAHFFQLLKEGSGDADIAYKKDEQLFRIYTQIKDHPVTPSDFRTILKQFREKDQASPNTYQQFVVACTGLSEDVEKLSRALLRIRGARDFFTQQDQITSDTKKSLAAIAKNLQVENELDFILDKVHFDSGWPDLTQIEQVVRLFCGGMLNVKAFQDKIRTFRSLFHPLYTYIVDSSGKTIDKSELEAKLHEIVENCKLSMADNGFTLRMYHWEDTPYELRLEYDEVLDWSTHFERKSRKVASATVWQDELLPALSDLQKSVRVNGVNRLIKLDGSACLSAGIALGWAFPETAEYIVQIQPRMGQKIEPWRTDVSSQTPFNLHATESEIDPEGEGLVVKFNLVADVTGDFDTYVSQSGTKFRSYLELTPENGIGESITRESAIGYARSAKRLIRQTLSKRPATRIHLFYAGPLGVAVFFGQLLNSMPEIQCYEQKLEGGYQLSCLIPKT
jgi:hypothetical protein